MKNVFTNIMNAIGSFVKAHTAITIATASAVAVTAVAVPVGIKMAKNNKLKTTPDKSISTTEKEIEEEVIYETSIPTEGTPVVSEPVEAPGTSSEEGALNEPISSTPVTTPNAPAPDPAPTAPSTTPTTRPTVTVAHPTSGLPYKQPADPETGISWDGKSPIIYTYPDGTTGTEKREGAKYERIPGKSATVVAVTYGEEMTPSTKPRICDECGKEKGHGGPDTCLRYWTGGGDNCPNCGEFVPENTCHTCNE